jgi:hypothetical protein
MTCPANNVNVKNKDACTLFHISQLEMNACMSCYGRCHVARNLKAIRSK